MKAMDPWLEETDGKLLIVTIWESSLLAVMCTVASYKWGCKIGKEEFVCEHLWHSNNVTKIMEFPCKIPVRWDIVYV